MRQIINYKTHAHIMMKRIVSGILLAISSLGLNAQNIPETSTLKVEEFVYKKPSASKVALNVLSAVATDVIHTSDKSMAPQINDAIAAATSGIPWLRIPDGSDSTPDGSDSTPDYILKGIITEVDNGLGAKFQNCLIIVNATVVDAKTGKEVHTKVVKGFDFSYLTGVVAQLKEGATADLTKNMRKYLFEVLPVTGTILQKGVEQVNGKVKESLCYVDLGSLHGILPGMPLFVVEDGSYKGELKVSEIMGDDLCSCKISSGTSYIEKNLAKGKTITITSKPKKIKDM